MPSENFLSASRKHFNDAVSLNASGRHDNAAYLSGYVVECALKAMVEADGSVNPRRFGHDVAALSTKAALLVAKLSRVRRQVTLPSSADYQDLLANWIPEERYLAEGATADSSSRLAAAKEAVEAIVVEMILDGSPL